MGSKTKVYFNASTDSQRIMPDDTLYNAIIKQNLSHLYQENYGLRKVQVGYYNSAAAQMLNYYNFSKWYSPDRLPTCTISGRVLPEETIIQHLCDKHDKERYEFVHQYFNYGIVRISDWIAYYLSNFYNYSIDNQSIKYNDLYYIYNNYTFISDTKIKCNLLGISKVKISKNKVIYFTTAPKDDEYDYQYETVYEEVKYIDANTNRFIKEELRQLYYDISEVGIGKGTTNTIVELLSEEVIDNYSSNISIEIPNIDTSDGYTFKYTFDKENIDYIWVYFPNLGKDDSIGQVNIPTITGPTGQSVALDAMPITMLRTNYYNVNEYDKASPRRIPAGDRDLVAYRPSELTKERCEEVEWILNSLSLNLDDILEEFSKNPDERYLSEVFLMFAIVPSDRHYITAKLLYETFKYLYEDIGLGNTGARSFYFHELPFNVEFKWESYQSNTLEKVIGPVGTYTHSIVKDENREDVYYVRTVYAVPYGYTKSYGKEGQYTKFILQYTDYYYEEREDTYTYPWTCWYVESDSDKGDSTRVCDYVKTLTSKNIINKTFLGRDYANRQGDEVNIQTYYDSELISSFGTTDSSIIRCYRQISEKVCEEVIIRGFTGYTSVGRAGYSDRVSAGVDNDNLTIPLLVPVLDRFTPMEKIEVMERTLRFILYTARLHVEKISGWKRFFGVFMMILAIVISVISIYFDGGFTAANVITAVSNMMIGMTIGIAVQIAIKLIIKFVDVPWLRQALIVIATIIGIMASGYFLDLSNLQLLTLTADQLMSAATTIIGDITATKMSALQKEVANFSDRYENKLNQFEKEMERLFGGLTTLDLYNAAYQNDNGDDMVTLINPATYYTNALESSYNFDLLFNDKTDILTSIDTKRFCDY